MLRVHFVAMYHRKDTVVMHQEMHPQCPKVVTHRDQGGRGSTGRGKSQQGCLDAAGEGAASAVKEWLRGLVAQLHAMGSGVWVSQQWKVATKQKKPSKMAADVPSAGRAANAAVVFQLAAGHP